MQQIEVGMTLSFIIFVIKLIENLGHLTDEEINQ